MPPYNLLIPGKLGCDVTKREGVAWHWFKYIFWILQWCFTDPSVWCLHIIYWFLASWVAMWRNGRGVAWHWFKYFLKPSLWCFTNSSVWFLHIIYWFLASWAAMWRNGRGVAWHWYKYFYLMPSLLCQLRANGTELDCETMGYRQQFSLWAFEGVKEPRHVTIWPIWF